MSDITATMLQDKLNSIERNAYDGIDFSQEVTTAYVLADELGERIDQLKAENAKLRELARELWEGYNDPRCEECQLKDTTTCADCPICAREALVIDRMRELGIEVDG